MNLRLHRSWAKRLIARVFAQTLHATQPGWSAPGGVQVGRWYRIQIDRGGTIHLVARRELDDGVTIAAASGALMDFAPGMFVGQSTSTPIKQS